MSVATALQQVFAAFDRMEIRYAVGGSVASSLRGNYRMTNDLDVLVEMTPEQAYEFSRVLGPTFYADAEVMTAAFRDGRPCNVIHMASGFKFDLFPVVACNRFSTSELDRRTFETTDIFGVPIEFAVATAEDILLAKLRWYRMGGESSEQQWKDVKGIVALQGSRLDRGYLQRWAHELGVADLLAMLMHSG